MYSISKLCETGRRSEGGEREAGRLLPVLSTCPSCLFPCTWDTAPFRWPSTHSVFFPLWIPPITPCPCPLMACHGGNVPILLVLECLTVLSGVPKSWPQFLNRALSKLCSRDPGERHLLSRCDLDWYRNSWSWAIAQPVLYLLTAYSLAVSPSCFHGG